MYLDPHGDGVATLDSLISLPVRGLTGILSNGVLFLAFVIDNTDVT